MAEADFRFELGGLAGQVAAHRFLETSTVVRVRLVQCALPAGWGAVVAELLPDIHVVAPAAMVVAVGQLEIPDADVGAAHRQVEARICLAQLLGQAPPTLLTLP